MEEGNEVFLFGIVPLSLNEGTTEIGFSSTQERWLIGITAVGSLLTLLGSAFIVASAIATGRWRKTYWRFVIGLSLTDALSGFSLFAGCVYYLATEKFFKDGPLCVAQGVITGMTYQMSNFYPLIMSVLLYRLIVVKKDRISWWMEILLHCGCIGFSLTLALVPLSHVAGSHYVAQAGWCWLAPTEYYSRIIFSYVWVWLIASIIIVLYIVIFFKLRSEMRQGLLLDAPLTVIAAGQTARYDAWKLLQLFFYPLAFVFVWIFPTINTILLRTGHTLFAMAMIKSVMLPSQGFINFLIYILTSDIYNSCWCCRRRVQREPSSYSLVPTEVTSDFDRSFSTIQNSPSDTFINEEADDRSLLQQTLSSSLSSEEDDDAEFGVVERRSYLATSVDLGVPVTSPAGDETNRTNRDPVAGVDGGNRVDGDQPAVAWEEATYNNYTYSPASSTSSSTFGQSSSLGRQMSFDI